jgi:hypothetical protein
VALGTIINNINWASIFQISQTNILQQHGDELVSHTQKFQMKKKINNEIIDFKT